MNEHVAIALIGALWGATLMWLYCNTDRRSNRELDREYFPQDDDR